MSRRDWTRGKAEHLELDAFDHYLEAKRREMGATPSLFWRDFLSTMGLFVLGAAFLALLAVSAPTLRALFLCVIGVA